MGKWCDNICMVLSSCDAYEDAWTPFCRQLTKNWPEFTMPIYLGTESKRFTYPGLNIQCPLADGKIYKQWSERLVKLLKKIESEYILFMLDDFWLTEPVNTHAFNEVFEYMKSNSKIGFICLKNENQTAPGQENFVNECDCKLLYESLYGRIFRITTQAGIWRKKYLLKLLRSHESAWYFESRANWRSRFYTERIFDVKETILKYPVGGFFWGGKCYRDYVHLYEADVIRECIEKRGLINFGGRREYPKFEKGFSYYWSIFKSVMPKL